MTNLRLEINGRTLTVTAAAGTPLLWVLRDHLGLCGTKYGCGAMLCGACTVHLDGEAARSCRLPVESAVGRRITTIEGLSPGGSHPLQQAWIAEQVPQCGYCQSGQIMTAAALLRRSPQPTAAEIRTAMASVLCRCGTYPRIERAIRRAAEGR